MSIPSQLPQFATVARSGALQALALQAGQVLDARIVGTAPNGGTQVEIKGQLLNLILPTSVKAGETIRLEVQGAGAQMRLALQAAPSPVAPAHVRTAPPLPQATMPLPSPVSAPAVSAQPVSVPAPASATLPPGGGAQSVPVVSGAGMTVAPGPGVSSTAIYPQTGTAGLPNPAAASAAAMANGPALPATPVAIAGAVRPVGAATGSANATAHAAPPSSPGAAPPAVTPQAALAQMVQAAVPRQGSIVALTTALSAVAGRVVLPEPVVRAAQQVLAGRVVLDSAQFDGEALKSAVGGSGVFQEANLARGQALPQPDMKSALLTLRQTLTTWLGQQAPVAAVAPLPPPLRGHIPRARGQEAPPLDPAAAPDEVGRQLLERTESALARVRLHQHASLPDPAGRTVDLSLDLPVMAGAHQTLMQLQIQRDQHGEAEGAAERGWQMRFALNLPDMGEVGAQITLRAGAVGVMLWASTPDATAALDAEIGALRQALQGAGLQAGAVLVRHGEPPATPATPSGHFVDSRR